MTDAAPPPVPICGAIWQPDASPEWHPDQPHVCVRLQGHRGRHECACSAQLLQAGFGVPR